MSFRAERHTCGYGDANDNEEVRDLSKWDEACMHRSQALDGSMIDNQWWKKDIWHTPLSERYKLILM